VRIDTGNNISEMTVLAQEHKMKHVKGMIVPTLLRIDGRTVV